MRTATLARCCLRQYRVKSSLLASMKGPPGSLRMLAVPSRTNRPLAVTGRQVPGRLPMKAISTEGVWPRIPDFVPGRVLPVPGRAYLPTTPTHRHSHTLLEQCIH